MIRPVRRKIAGHMTASQPAIGLRCQCIQFPCLRGFRPQPADAAFGEHRRSLRDGPAFSDYTARRRGEARAFCGARTP